jgi:hypothetical protein
MTCQVSLVFNHFLGQKFLYFGKPKYNFSVSLTHFFLILIFIMLDASWQKPESKEANRSQVWWLMPIILATQEVKIGRIEVWGQPGQEVSETHINQLKAVHSGTHLSSQLQLEAIGRRVLDWGQLQAKVWDWVQTPEPPKKKLVQQFGLDRKESKKIK